MDSEEEFSQFSDAEKQPSPVPERRFKRLRKVNEKLTKEPNPTPSSDEPLPIPSFDDAPSVHEAYSPLIEAADGGVKSGEDFEEASDRSGSQSEGFKEGHELESGFDCLEVEEGSSGAKRALKFDSVAVEYDGTGGYQMGEEAEAEGNGGTSGYDGPGGDQMGAEVEAEGTLETEIESDKKRKNIDEVEDKQEKKKEKKRVKSGSDGHDEMPLSAASKRRGDKERRERLKELRSESQRLLRETRDASFKPVPIVQKSVSSVLEKIRKRKLELSKKLDIPKTNYVLDGDDSGSRELILDFDTENSPVEDLEFDKATETENEETCVPDVEVSLDAQIAERLEETSKNSLENVTAEVDLDGPSKQTFRALVDDTQDIVFDSQTSDSKDELPSSPQEEFMRPSILAMNLMLDSAPDDISDDEEENDKENIDPCLQKSADLTSPPTGDPVRAFVDEEAEEEDDSDNDLACFQDNEEDEDNMDPEEFNDMIATGYEERPIDGEIRNELHQKWLEQQDAAGTEKLLQKLKCGSKQKEKDFIVEQAEVSEESEDDGEGFLDDPEEYIVTRNAVRMNLKRAKEMIPLMFTDKDDAYVSSDDEETEKYLAKQRLSHKAEQDSTFLSPAEDEGSRGIFGLIKKLNNVPDTRRKAKMTSTSNFHMLSVGGNRTASSKSSFLSRGSRNSLPSLQKNGPSVLRSFIFERDDSNSRSAISEDSSDLVQRDNRPKKTATAKFSNSQVRSSAQNTQTMAEKNSGPSLHEILRCPSLQSSNCVGGKMVNQVEAIYAAFKLDQNLLKKESNLSIRTA